MTRELRYLASLEGRGIRPGLSRVKGLLRHLGNPQQSAHAVIVAGTNGKGSTAATLSSIISRSGYRAGLYTSPHLVDLRERWQINGRSVIEKSLIGAIVKLREAVDATGLEPTYFEALTVIAFLLFAEARCDLLLLEVGLGGRLDATNVVRPVVALITSIGLDHTELLGSTLTSIAREKAGVIHRGTAALTSNADRSVLEQLRRRCAKLGADLEVVNESSHVSGVVLATDGTRFNLKTPVRRYALSTPLAGRHQIENVTLAVRGAELLATRFPGISKESIEEGVAQTRWRGRLEVFRFDDKDIYVDGGHNPAAIRRIAEFAETLARPRALVFGMMRDKDVASCVRELFPRFDSVWVTEPRDGRASAAGTIVDLARAIGSKPRIETSPERAIRQALSSDTASVLVCGSLYLAGSAIGYLDRLRARTAAKRRSIENPAAATT